MFAGEPVRRRGAALFSLLQRSRSYAYDRGLVPIEKVDGVKVVSVGNLRVGGTGKTPLVIYLATFLRSEGVPVAVVSRGYGGRLQRTGGAVSLGDGRGPVCSSRDGGDEPVLMASRLPDVPVRVGRHRARQVALARDDGAAVVLLDDGFQHRRLYRHLDIVLVSPGDFETAGEGRLMPAGALREPLDALARAHCIGALDCGDATERSPDFLMAHHPREWVAGDGAAVPLALHAGARAFLVAGIARPERFAQTARNAGVEIVGTRFFRDHHRLSRDEMRAVEEAAAARGADVLVTTEKDLARGPVGDTRTPLLALRIEVSIQKGDAELKQRIRDVLI